jgi:hypothetical protein
LRFVDSSRQTIPESFESLLPKILLDSILLTSSDSGDGNGDSSADEGSYLPDSEPNPEDPDEDPDDPKPKNSGDSAKSESEDSGESESDDSDMGSAERVLKDDLDELNLAKSGDQRANNFLRRQYSSFYDHNVPETQTLSDIEEYLKSEIQAEKNINSNGKRELDDSEEDLKPHKRIKFDNDDSNNNSGPSLGGAPPTASPSNGGNNTNPKVMEDIMYHFIIFISSIGESISIILSNIM